MALLRLLWGFHWFFFNRNAAAFEINGWDLSIERLLEKEGLHKKCLGGSHSAASIFIYVSRCVEIQLISVRHLYSHQGSSLAKQLGAEAYLECSAFTSEKSIHSVFRTAALACMNKMQPASKASPDRRLSKRLLHLPSKTDLLSSTFSKDKSRSCNIMWILPRSCWESEAERRSGVWEQRCAEASLLSENLPFSDI